MHDGIQIPTRALIDDLMPLRPVAGCETLLAHQAEDFFEFWHQWERLNKRECPIPFWATVWPGAIALARYFLEHPDVVAGRSVLDLGCGGGVAGIAAVKVGAASVVANDIDPFALEFCQLNAAANHVELAVNQQDLTSGTARFNPQVILVGDMFYERDASVKLLTFLARQKELGVRVLVADGQRTFAPKGTEHQLLLEEIVPVSCDLEGVSERVVRLVAL